MTSLRYFWLLFFITCSLLCRAQQRISLLDELRELHDISRLPAVRNNTTVAQTSTYDPTGGNNDGFSGTYSFIRRNADSSLVIFDEKGPGSLHRIWTPTATTDTLDFYIDDTTKPVLSICYTDLFTGKVFPFVAPLCGNAIGGYYCYFPILYQSRCLVVCRGKQLQFHQFQFRSFTKGTKVQKFSTVLDSQERMALNRIATLYNNDNNSVTGFYSSAPHVSESSQNLAAGETEQVFSLSTGGRITGIEFKGDPADLQLLINWDGSEKPAVDCPLSLFFGYAFGQPAMKSLLIGITKGKHYSYLPMPFDRSASIRLINKGSAAKSVAVKVFYTNTKRKPSTEGKLYVHWQNEDLTSEDPYHVFLDTKGTGSYIGTILVAEGEVKGQTVFFEGDDSTVSDGVTRIHGTGSEDYFNGGWYDIAGRWDSSRNLPLSGCLGYSSQLARTGGYRFYLNDKLPFSNSIYHCIEHGRTKAGEPAHYSSLAFYYKQ